MDDGPDTSPSLGFSCYIHGGFRNSTSEPSSIFLKSHHPCTINIINFSIFTLFRPKALISQLLSCKNPTQIRQVHAQVAVNGMLLHNLVVTNKLLYIYAYHEALADAYALFGVLRDRETVSWSVIVGGFAKIGDYMNCFGTFREYIRSGERPDNYTLPFVIRACRDTMDLQMGRLIHHTVYKFALHTDILWWLHLWICMRNVMLLKMQSSCLIECLKETL
ncbi:unnamed protein product [Camellia sinensis]